MGFRVTNFAYPFASATPAVEQQVANCGYNSARGLGDLKSKAAPTLTEVAEPLPVPTADLFFTKAPDEVDNTWAVADMQAVVTQAEAGGGWVQLTFHHFDSATDPLTVTTTNFQAYVNWLVTEQTAGRIVVKTVRQVMAAQFPDPANPALDLDKPLVNGPAAPPPITVGNLIQNPSLETAGPVATGLPYCWAIGAYGTNTHTFTSVSRATRGPLQNRWSFPATLTAMPSYCRLWTWANVRRALRPAISIKCPLGTRRRLRRNSSSTTERALARGITGPQVRTLPRQQRGPRPPGPPHRFRQVRAQSAWA